MRHHNRLGLTYKETRQVRWLLNTPTTVYTNFRLVGKIKVKTLNKLNKAQSFPIRSYIRLSIRVKSRYNF